MLYIIDDKYYMLRNREYVNVDVRLNEGEISIKPNRNDVIEANDGLKVTNILIDDVIEKLKNTRTSENSNNHRRNKYDM